MANQTSIEPSKAREVKDRPPKRKVTPPNIKRSLAQDLVVHERLHVKVQQMIPSLSDSLFFDWSRRYWIAVLIGGKTSAKTTLSAKDFVWMKGNRFSTVATILESYAVATMTDPDSLVLLLGNESLVRKDQVQEMDYFNDRLVVFRAIKISGNELEAKGRSLIRDAVPLQKVIALD